MTVFEDVVGIEMKKLVLKNHNGRRHPEMESSGIKKFKCQQNVKPAKEEKCGIILRQFWKEERADQWSTKVAEQICFFSIKLFCVKKNVRWRMQEENLQQSKRRL